MSKYFMPMPYPVAGRKNCIHFPRVYYYRALREAIMKPNYAVLTPHHEGRIQIGKRTAYHLAGQAVAIVLGNREKQLPELYFKVVIKEKDLKQPTDLLARRRGQYTANIQGGRLIEHLPFSFSELTQHLSNSEFETYKNAFEADIMNLLSGPLAEAMYVAFRDDEVFSANLVNVAALRFYGGNPELALVSEYMDCLFLNKADYDQKLKELYVQAYQFLNRKKIWYVITKLAEILENSTFFTIDYEDVNTVLERNLVAYARLF